MVEAMKTVLVIDDDATLQGYHRAYAGNRGVRPAFAENGEVALAQAMALKPTLVLVDLQMPGLGGMEVCKQIRAAGMKTPLIVLSAIGDEMDKVLLLEMGADDYVVKPFGSRELLAPPDCAPLLRRSSADDTKVISFGDVEVDLSRRVVLKKNEETKLTRAEYKSIPHTFAESGSGAARDIISNSVSGYQFRFPNTRTVDALCAWQEEAKPTPTAPRHFVTVHGVGYHFPAVKCGARNSLTRFSPAVLCNQLEQSIYVS